MEAATPLRLPHVHAVGQRLVIDGLVVDDPTAVRLVREREEAGEPAERVLLDALEIGARVLDREQVGANAEWVKSELDKVSREVEVAFSERAREVADGFGRKVDEVFGPDSGHLSKALDRHFSDGSSLAVQNRVRHMVGEVMAASREDLLRQFSAADGHNPLADFKAGALAAVREAGERQDVNLRAMAERMAALQGELQGLRAEREKLEELDAERDRGTAKGRTFEEEVADALDAIASGQGDDCDAVGDLKGATRKTGDVVVSIEGCRGPALGRIVFEAKTGRLSKPEALRELDRGMAERDADFGVLVVPSEDKLPARMRALREYNGDKLIVALVDPDASPRLALEVAYALARARVLMARAGDDGVDSTAVRDTVERALAAMEDVRKVKSQLTGARTSIDNAEGVLVEMAERVRAQLRQVDALVVARDATGGP